MCKISLSRKKRKQNTNELIRITNDEDKSKDVIMSLLESSLCPCSVINLVNAASRPIFVKIFKFPITVTKANTPYSSVPNLLINTGMHKNVSNAVITSKMTPLMELFTNVFFFTIFPRNKPSCYTYSQNKPYGH